MTTREQLHQLVDQLPEEEVPVFLALLQARHASDFWNPPSLEEVIARQGVKPVERFEDLLGDFWPEDETADEFMAAIEEWRREGMSTSS